MQYLTCHACRHAPPTHSQPPQKCNKKKFSIRHPAPAHNPGPWRPAAGPAQKQPDFCAFSPQPKKGPFSPFFPLLPFSPSPHFPTFPPTPTPHFPLTAPSPHARHAAPKKSIPKMCSVCTFSIGCFGQKEKGACRFFSAFFHALALLLPALSPNFLHTLVRGGAEKNAAACTCLPCRAWPWAREKCLFLRAFGLFRTLFRLARPLAGPFPRGLFAHASCAWRLPRCRRSKCKKRPRAAAATPFVPFWGFFCVFAPPLPPFLRLAGGFSAQIFACDTLAACASQWREEKILHFWGGKKFFPRGERGKIFGGVEVFVVFGGFGECGWLFLGWAARGALRRWRGGCGRGRGVGGGERGAFFGRFWAGGARFLALSPLWGALFAFLRVFSGCFFARGRGVAWATFLGPFLGGTMAGRGASGPFWGRFFPFSGPENALLRPGRRFWRGKMGFWPGCRAGWGQGGGIVMHSTCLGGCQIFSSIARFSFLPAHALRCSLLLCAPHYYTHAQRSPAARLFALARLRLARSCTNQTTDKSQRIASKACSAAYNPAFAPKVVCNAVSRRHLLHPHSSQAAPRPFRRNALSTSANVSPGNPVSQTTNVTSQLLSSVDSGILEAFSHYPTRGSLSA